MINREKLNKEKLKKYALNDEQLEQVSGGYKKVVREAVNSGAVCINNCNGAGVNYCEWSECPFDYK